MVRPGLDRWIGCGLAGRHRFPFERLGVVAVRGRQSPITIYTVPAP